MGGCCVRGSEGKGGNDEKEEGRPLSFFPFLCSILSGRKKMKKEKKKAYLRIFSFEETSQL